MGKRLVWFASGVLMVILLGFILTADFLGIGLKVLSFLLLGSVAVFFGIRGWGR